MLHTRTRDALAFQIGLAIFLTIILLIIIVPFWQVIVTAFVPLDIYTREGIPFFLSPTKWTVEAFKQLMSHSQFSRALWNSVVITVRVFMISFMRLLITDRYVSSVPLTRSRRLSEISCRRTR